MAATTGIAQGPDSTARTVTTPTGAAERPAGRSGPRPRGGRGPDGPSGSPADRVLESTRNRLRFLRRRFWDTLPARLRLLRTAILLLTAACAGLLVISGLAASGTWDAISGRHAPRTVSAAGLNLALNDMDAQAVNSLLANGNAGKGRMAVPYDKAIQLYDEARRSVSRELRTLAVAAEDDAQAQRTVELLTDDFARYQEFIGRALENDTRSGGKAAAVDDYRNANDLLSRRLLPEARSLVEANDGQFEAAYAAERADLGAQSALLLALGAALLAALVLLQWYLARRFHRVLNPGLIAATVCALTAVVLGTQALTATSEQLRLARRDAFDSVVALSRARAIAYDANAEESRYLLDRDHRSAHEAAFLAKSQSLYGMEGAGLASYEPQLAATWQAYRRDHHDKRFTGEFRRELDNITFAGERAAAERTVEAYAVYQRDDRTIRSLVAAGKEQEAVAFCISWEPGKSNAHFGAWMTALDEVTGINRGAFDTAADDGRDAVTGLLPWAVAALLAAVVLATLGLRPRLAEFR
ncbi:hypothetical protein OG453_31585 [Streptomyces sp. NBC_01381]|uniref:hypothetical protein n=1 Tax=Streptomyces sp. NBC_01381 TaxID=2903845 RepID=UPI00225C42C9|nr:hypothetical protein [Streptomyces sp. NBC_01381]MCX4671172.1 hypothetical protein [Streptomyces sp. NBC_01381]